MQELLLAPKRPPQFVVLLHVCLPAFPSPQLHLNCVIPSALYVNPVPQGCRPQFPRINIKSITDLNHL